MKSNLLKFIILALCIVMLISVAACSTRPQTGEEDPGSVIVDPVDNNKIITVSKSTAWSYINKSVANLDSTVYEDPEWLNIDFGVKFVYHNYEKVGDKYTNIAKNTVDYLITVKANINLKDNSKSLVFIEVKNAYHNFVVLGFYYYNSTVYLDLAGTKYYIDQLNMSQLGVVLSQLLKEKDLDIVRFMGNALAGKIDIEAIASFVPLIWGVVFEGDCTVETADGGKYQYISQFLKLDFIMKMIMKGEINFAGLINLVISWESFGLPANMDDLLRPILGFGLEDIIKKQWPSMTGRLYAVTQLGKVSQADLTTKQDYIFNGFGIDINSATNEYDLDLVVSPFKLQTSNTSSVDIKMAGYNFGSAGKGTVYSQGSLTNVELNAKMKVDSETTEELTINSLLGNMLGDLGALGSMPIEVAGDTSYEFDVKVAASLDLFNNANNKAQIAFKYNNREILAVYLAPDLVMQTGSTVLYNTLYIDTHNLTSGGKTLIPQLRLPNLNITQVLAGSTEVPGLLSKYMKYFDPYYANTTTATRPTNAASAAEEEAGGFDLNGLLTLLLTKDNSGNLKYLHFPPKGESIFSLGLDNYGINTLLGMFLPNVNLGINNFSLSIDLKDPLDSIRVDLGVTESLNVSLGIGSTNEDGTYNTGLSFLKKPNFDFTAIGIDKNGNVMENAEALRADFKSMSGSMEYGAKIIGNVELGSTGGTELDLSAVVGSFVENVFLSLGIENSSKLSIEYEIQAGINLLKFSEVGLLIDLYLKKTPDSREPYPFMSLYYSGAEDTLYLNTQVKEGYDLVTQLGAVLPITKIVDGAIPKISIKDIGIKSMLENMSLDLSGIYSLLGVSNASMAFSLVENSEEVEVETDGNSILDLLAGVLDKVSIADGRIGVIMNAQVLSVLLQLLKIDVAGELPKVNGEVYLHLGTALQYDKDGN
ncbi:hypothetical protein EOM82_00940, partial [bacterium]|nr:hypothetical protein [bacterium]